MDLPLMISCDRDSAPYRRMGENILANAIREEIGSYFGPLVLEVKNNILINPFLLDSYIKDFSDHSKEGITKEINKKFGKDINFYSDIKSWADGKLHFIPGFMGSSDEFDPTTWGDPFYPRIICGPKGSGKTTLILYKKYLLDKDSSNYCLYIRLSMLGDLTPLQFIRQEMIDKLDDTVLDLCNKNKISPKMMILNRFPDLWKLNNVFPDIADSPEEVDRKRRDLSILLINLNQHKYSRFEFKKYVKQTLGYLEKEFGIKTLIMLDDVDRLDSTDDARLVIDRSKGLARTLGYTPIMVTARDETMALLLDSESYIHRISIIPPSFRDVLIKRRDLFNLKFNLSEEKKKLFNISNLEIKNHINLIINSILHDEVYVNLVTYHYDLDILLDMVRCIIKSPLITMNLGKSLIEKNLLIPWHIILDTLMRYKYKNFYQENSFVLNVFENNSEPPTFQNALVRLRLLEVLRHRFEGINSGIRVSRIYADMDLLGYGRPDVIRALKAFANQRLIVTGRAYNTFYEEQKEILPQRAIAYYLDFLIYNYRYIQNLLPVTHVPFQIPLDIVEMDYSLAAKKLKLLDKIILKFIDFIKLCETLEIKNVKSKNLLEEIRRDVVFSEELKTKIEEEIKRIKGLDYY